MLLFVVGSGGFGVGVRGPTCKAVGGTALEEDLGAAGVEALGVGPRGEDVAGVDAAVQDTWVEEGADEEVAVGTVPEFGAEAGLFVQTLFDGEHGVVGPFRVEFCVADLVEFGELAGGAEGEADSGFGCCGEADGGVGVAGGAASGTEGDSAVGQTELLAEVGARADGIATVVVEARGDAIEEALVGEVSDVGAEVECCVFALLPAVVGVPDPFVVVAAGERIGLAIDVFEVFAEEGGVVLDEPAAGGRPSGGGVGQAEFVVCFEDAVEAEGGFGAFAVEAGLALDHR